MTLTTTQHSALVELQRYGSLRPSSRSFSKYDGRRTFQRRTLQGLVDAGYAEWRTSVRGTRRGPVTYEGFVTPTAQTEAQTLTQEPAQFTTSYMDKALFNLADVIEQAKSDLRNVEFDTLVGTGFSGGVVIPALALALGKNFVMIRKETDDSHHGKGRLIGSLGRRWIFVDDFVSTGSTQTRGIKKIDEAAMLKGHRTDYVGDYLYCNLENRYQPNEEY